MGEARLVLAIKLSNLVEIRIRAKRLWIALTKVPRFASGPLRNRLNCFKGPPPKFDDILKPRLSDLLKPSVLGNAIAH